MKFLKSTRRHTSVICVAAIALSSCGGGGSSEPTTIGGTTPAPVAGSPGPAPTPGPAAGPSPAVPAPPTVGGTPATPPAAPPPGVGQSIAGLPKDFSVGALLLSADGSKIKAISGAGQIANSDAAKSDFWALDNAPSFTTQAAFTRKARLLNGKSFILGAITARDVPATVWISNDSEVWKEATLPATNAPDEFWDIAYGNGRYVISGDSKKTSGQSGLMWSDDGTTWRNVLNSELSDLTWTSITFGKGLFVATEEETGKTATSTNGVDWQVQTIAQPEPGVPAGGLKRITFDATRNLFVISANARSNSANNGVIGTIYTSTDGITWVRRDTGYPANIIRIECDKSLCVGSTASTAASLTPVLLTAAGVDPSSWKWTEIKYAPSTNKQIVNHIAKTSSGWIAGGDGLLLISKDGIDWFKVSSRQ
jgi:hypothetical protein